MKSQQRGRAVKQALNDQLDAQVEVEKQVNHVIWHQVSFSCIHSEYSALISDIQAVTTEDGLRIIDFITHTTGDRPLIGDELDQRINRWITNHKCNDFCKDLPCRDPAFENLPPPPF
ncbi:hypothetical protein FRC03_006281 [Tulasnella sp. 419]|nr:hypothetical protein FRC03_006281 [Tulasnella sp. 419]